ncbi:hypothetical protein PC128_g9784 [Phytophthora cactorum]|nr:hypothetical protein PC128_g9784 [Phytophthora cactorum]
MMQSGITIENGSKERSSASFINLLRYFEKASMLRLSRSILARSSAVRLKALHSPVIILDGCILAVQDIQHQRHQIRRIPSLEVGETSTFLTASRYVFRQ